MEVTLELIYQILGVIAVILSGFGLVKIKRWADFLKDGVDVYAAYQAGVEDGNWTPEEDQKLGKEFRELVEARPFLKTKVEKAKKFK